MRKIFGILLLISILALVPAASAALPATVGGTLIYKPASHPNDYYQADLQTGTNPELPSGIHALFCANQHTTIYTGWHEWSVYTSLKPVPVGATADWDRINYVINHPDTLHGRATWHELQAAFWHYQGDSPPYHSSINPYNTDIYQDLIADADANGEGFVPQSGETYAVVMYISQTVQPSMTFEPVPYPTPEFPSAAIPVVLLIGMLGAVFVLKSRRQ